MDVKIITDDFNIHEYNAKVTHPLQSWEWGVARKEMSLEVLRIGEFSGETLIDVYQISFHQIPYTPWKIGYLPRSKFPSTAIFDFLQEYGKSHKVIFIKFEPNERLKSDIRHPTSDIHKSPHPLFSDWTVVLNLKQSEEEILKNMKPKTRYNIRLAQKKGVVVREESNEVGFDKFVKLYFETCRRQSYYGHSINYHQTVWKHLKEKIAHIFIAYYNNEPLATFELFYFNRVLYYPYGGTSIQHRNVMAANLLMWEAIRFGKKMGAEIFDMWNSLSPDHQGNPAWEGFTRFKEGYGGEFVPMMGSFDLVIDRGIYQLYSQIYKLRNIYLKLRRFLPL